MNKAEEYRNIAMAITESRIDNAIKDVKDKIEAGLYRHSNDGRMSYSLNVDKLYKELQDEFMNKLKPIIKYFENDGFIVCVEDTGNGYWMELAITVSFSGKVEKYSTFRTKQLVYCTNINQ